MVDFHNPVVIEKDFLAAVKLWHVLDGLFIWEFVTTLDYEWSVIRGQRQYRWTIWIYSLTRVCTLIAVVLNMVGFDSSGPINCQLWIIFELIFASSAFAGASLLIVLRIIAIWNRNRIAVAIAICAWITDVAFLIHNIALIHVAWVPTDGVCEVLYTSTETFTSTIITMFSADVVLLLTMLVGLLRLRHEGTMFGLGKFLWSQGLIWLFLATVAGLTPVVFIGLNLNYPFDLMFQTPALIVMSIAATWMHRSLTDYTDSGCQAFVICPILKGCTAKTDPKQILVSPIPQNRVEVALHKSPEDGLPSNISQGGQKYGSHRMDSQLQDRPLVLSIGNDIESGVQRE